MYFVCARKVVDALYATIRVALSSVHFKNLSSQVHNFLTKKSKSKKMHVLTLCIHIYIAANVVENFTVNTFK